ncbi:MAG: hypothetical protein ABR575_11745 [Actinomycetota bacterium]
MFVQVIQGRAGDQEGLRRQFEGWETDVRAGAIGFLGSTHGLTDDGEFLACARFESEEAARRNSDRAEQSNWWNETSKYFDGDVTFHDSTDIIEFGRGGSDDAGFVQVIQGRVTDADAMRAAMADRPDDNTVRPDVVGGYTALHDGDRFTTVVYFTSEEEARAGESKPEFSEAQQEMAQSMQDVRYYDLRSPTMVS